MWFWDESGIGMKVVLDEIYTFGMKVVLDELVFYHTPINNDLVVPIATIGRALAW